MTGPAFRREPPEFADAGRMHPLPEGGIESVEAEEYTPRDPGRPYVETDPVVRYTVKELIVRLDEKLDGYVRAQADLTEAVRKLVPDVASQGTRLERIELDFLNRKAIRDWRQNAWHLLAGTSGVTAIAAIIITYVHH